MKCSFENFSVVDWLRSSLYLIDIVMLRAPFKCTQYRSVTVRADLVHLETMLLPLKLTRALAIKAELAAFK